MSETKRERDRERECMCVRVCVRETEADIKREYVRLHINRESM